MVLEFDCEVKTQLKSFGSKTVEDGDFEWNAVWKAYSVSENQISVSLTLALLKLGDKKMLVEFKILPDLPRMPYTVIAMNRAVFDGQHQSVQQRDAFVLERSKEYPNLFPDTRIKVVIYKVEEVAAYDLNNQKWPVATALVRHGGDCRIEMKQDVLWNMNPQYDKLQDDMLDSTLSKSEATAFFEFTGALFNRWFYGQPGFVAALRNGFKLGFTKNWEALDKDDSDLDFLSRTSLPVYPNMMDYVNPPLDDIGAVNQRMVIDKSPIRLIKENPFLRSWTLRPQDERTQNCQFIVYLQDAKDGMLLMGGAIFNCSKEDVAKQFLAKIHVQVIVDEHVKIQHRAVRAINPLQRTMCFVLDKVDMELEAAMTDRNVWGKERLHVMVSVTKTDTNLWHVPNYQEYTVAEKGAQRLAKEAQKESRLESRKRRLDAEKDAEKDTENGKEEDHRTLMMPGVVDGFIQCKSGQKIGVNREFVTMHSTFLHEMFNNQHFPDCGGTTIKVSDDTNWVWAALQIMYHRSLLINMWEYEGIIEIGHFWGCLVIINYVEIAMLKSNLPLATEKQEIARKFNLDVANYILRHPEYAEDYKFNFDSPSDKIEAKATESEIDGGPEGRSSVVRPAVAGPDRVHQQAGRRVEHNRNRFLRRNRGVEPS